MGSFKPRISFNPTPAYSRLPHDDEAYVMKAFARHASHCTSCAEPYEVHKRGGTLCPKGHQRALDVAQYVYNKGGKAYSLVDREGSQRVQIEIPAGCESVRSLLKAMERGLRIMKRAPSVSYDKTYYVPARPVPQRNSRYVKPRLETAEPPTSYSPPRRSDSRRYIGRGSMFEADLKEQERYFKPSVFYRVTSEAPPVPPKDKYYW